MTWRDSTKFTDAQRAELRQQTQKSLLEYAEWRARTKRRAELRDLITTLSHRRRGPCETDVDTPDPRPRRHPETTRIAPVYVRSTNRRI